MKPKEINRTIKFKILSNKNINNYTCKNFNKYYEQGRHVINKAKEDKNKDLKLILLYSPVFPNFKDGYGQWEWYFPLESPYTCKNGFSCRLTTDHHQLKEVILLFYTYVCNPDILKLGFRCTWILVLRILWSSLD